MATATVTRRKIPVRTPVARVDPVTVAPPPPPVKTKREIWEEAYKKDWHPDMRRVWNDYFQYYDSGRHTLNALINYGNDENAGYVARDERAARLAELKKNFNPTLADKFNLLMGGAVQNVHQVITRGRLTSCCGTVHGSVAQNKDHYPNGPEMIHTYPLLKGMSKPKTMDTHTESLTIVDDDTGNSLLITWIDQ